MSLTDKVMFRMAHLWIKLPGQRDTLAWVALMVGLVHATATNWTSGLTVGWSWMACGAAPNTAERPPWITRCAPLSPSSTA